MDRWEGGRVGGWEGGRVGGRAGRVGWAVLQGRRADGGRGGHERRWGCGATGPRGWRAAGGGLGMRAGGPPGSQAAVAGGG